MVKFVMEKTQRSRPIILTLEFSEEIRKEELFQNEVIRPIIKMLNDVLIAYFRDYIAVKKLAFSLLSEKEKNDFIESAFNKDIPFRSETRGLIIGHFSTDEFMTYTEIKRGTNKRINNIVKERIRSKIKELSE